MIPVEGGGGGGEERDFLKKVIHKHVESVSKTQGFVSCESQGGVNFRKALLVVLGRLEDKGAGIMANPYHLTDLLDENTESELHRATREDGGDFTFTRVKLEPESLASLYGVGVFNEALSRLKLVRHANLHKVIEGGMDEDDGAPWVTSVWTEGKPLSELDLKEQDIRSLGLQCHALVRELNELAGVVNFDPARILVLWTADGELHTRFSIDYFRWFQDRADGKFPGKGQSVGDQIEGLLKGLLVKQLKPVVKKREEGQPIPMVETRSPALQAYEPPSSRWLLKALLWVGFAFALGLIVWFTWVGTKRVNDNLRKEDPLENSLRR